MQVSNIFFSSSDRLRSGWRLAIFCVAFVIATSCLSVVLALILSLRYDREEIEALLTTNWGLAIQGIILFVCATGLGYGCQRLFEGLPFKALGWSLHPRWFRDWIGGSLLGAVTLLFATLIATLSGSFRFVFSDAQMLPAVIKTLIFSCLIFIFAAAAEEVLFRGYPLQTMTRANLIWLGIIITSVFFALAHQANPNQNATKAVKMLAFINTTLAGVWLAAIYLKTRSLWLPLGVHWAWNWMMAAVLGLPVSGITTLTPHPLLQATDLGPSWLTGGPYGIEGGAACTIALLLSTSFIWRTKLFSATEEMKTLTSRETPSRAATREDSRIATPSV